MKVPCAVIAEDEPLVRRELAAMLADLWPALEIRAEVGDGPAALVALERYQPDILFLDIQMPGMSGLEVAHRSGGSAHIVYISAFDQFAIAAFEAGALDYLLKPVSRDRLLVTVERLRERLRGPAPDLRDMEELLQKLGRVEQGYFRWLTVPQGQEFRVISVDEILYLHSDQKYTEVVTRKSTFLISTPLKQLRARLDPEAFWQIHRGVIVNVSAIESVHRTFRGLLEVKVREQGTFLPVSAAYAHLFKIGNTF